VEGSLEPVKPVWEVHIGAGRPKPGMQPPTILNDKLATAFNVGARGDLARNVAVAVASQNGAGQWVWGPERFPPSPPGYAVATDATVASNPMTGDFVVAAMIWEDTLRRGFAPSEEVVETAG
jgi:hypothetical protein